MIKRHRARTSPFLTLTVLGMVLLISVGTLMAQEGFSVTSWTVDGGGGVSVGGNVTVTGAIGQPDAGAPLSGGNYHLSGGFSQSGESNIVPDQRLFLPLVSGHEGRDVRSVR